MPSLSELWHLSGIFYRELAFRSLMEMRRAARSEKAIMKVVQNSLTSLTINKVFLALVFASAAVFAGIQGTPMAYGSYLLLVTFLFALFFLQSVTYFFQVNFDILKTLPVGDRERNTVAMLTFLRIFDLPLALNLLLFPLVCGIAAGGFSAVPAFFGIASAEMLAVAIVTYLSRVFYRRLASPTSGWKSALRFIFIVIWGLSFFVLYAFMAWMPLIYARLEDYQDIFFAHELLFRIVYPFSFSYLIVAPDILSSLASLIYFLLSFLAFRWAFGVATKRVVLESQDSVEINFRFSSPMVAMLRKDFRITTRNPGLAMLLLLPAMEGLLLMSLGMTGITLLSMLSTFTIIFLYSIFGYEKRDLMGTLPVSRGFVYLGKVLMASFVFLVSLILVDAYSLFAHYVVNSASQLLMLPGIFSAGVLVLYLGDLLGLRTSVAMNAVGFLLLIALGNAVVLLPVILLSLLTGVFSIAVAGIASSLLFLVSILLLLRLNGAEPHI